MGHPVLKPGASSDLRDVLTMALVFFPGPAGKGSFTFSYCHSHGAAIHIFVLLFLNTFVSCKNFLLGCSGVECFDF